MSHKPPSPTALGDPRPDNFLDSWKEIAAYLLRKSILSPVESINLGIDFQAHTTTPKGWPLLMGKKRGKCFKERCFTFCRILWFFSAVLMDNYVQQGRWVHQTNTFSTQCNLVTF